MCDAPEPTPEEKIDAILKGILVPVKPNVCQGCPLMTPYGDGKHYGRCAWLPEKRPYWWPHVVYSHHPERGGGALVNLWVGENQEPWSCGVRASLDAEKNSDDG